VRAGGEKLPLGISERRKKNMKNKFPLGKAAGKKGKRRGYRSALENVRRRERKKSSRAECSTTDNACARRGERKRAERSNAERKDPRTNSK